MEIIGITDDSFNTGTRVYYTVELSGGLFTDVMCIREGKGCSYEYLMQCADGGTVYTSKSDGDSVGDVEDYGVSGYEASGYEVIRFVLDSQQKGGESL